MLRTVLTHLRAQWMGALALLLVLAGGTAYAANTVFSGDIVNGEVKTVDLANRAVTMAKLALDSVDSDTVADDSLGSRDLRNNAAVQSPDVRNESLSGVDIAPESLTGADIADGSVGSGDVANESLWGADIQDNSLNGVDIQNESLTGNDVVESTLGQVPAAKIGGLGRWTGGGTCDPESENYVDCAIVTLNLPQPARVLLNGEVSAWTEANASSRAGDCELVSDAGRIVPNSKKEIWSFDENGMQTAGLTAVTPVQTAGSHDYAVDCNQSAEFGAIEYFDVGISAVALSAD
jgi:hypothetical protein